MNAVELVGRMLLALGAVLGIMWALARFAKRPLSGKSDAVLTVLARQQLNRSSSVAILKVADRALVLGVSDQGVRLLAETDLAPIEAALVVEPKPTRRQNRELAEQPSLSGDDTTSADPELPAAGAPSAAAIAGTVGATTLTGIATAVGTKKSALDGSILSPKIWSQLVNLARDVTVRR